MPVAPGCWDHAGCRRVVFPVPTLSGTVPSLAPSSPSTTTLPQQEAVATYTVKSALTLDFESLPDDVTAESLVGDTAFSKNVRDSIATGFSVDPSKVTVTKIEIVSRRLSSASKRKMQGSKLKVEYEMVTTSLAEATQIKETLGDPTNAESFSAAFSATLAEKEAASGRQIAVKDVVAEKAVVQSDKPAPEKGEAGEGSSSKTSLTSTTLQSQTTDAAMASSCRREVQESGYLLVLCAFVGTLNH